MIIKIQDKEYTLKYDINALALLEDITGSSISNALQENMGIAMLRNLFYVGLKRNHKDITVEQVGDIMQDYIDEHKSVERLSALITEAFEKSNLATEKK